MQKYRAERHKISKNQYDILRKLNDWQLVDIPPNEWSDFPEWMQQNCIGIEISGSLSHSQISHGLEVIGGIDWLRLEINPRPNETEGNAYHYVITASGNEYYLNGPFPNGTRVPHWFTENHLDAYTPEDKQEN